MIGLRNFIGINCSSNFIKSVTFLKSLSMEKRVLGIILSLLGVAGLIIAGVQFLNGSGSSRNIKEIIIYGTLGAIFFFAGISLVKNTKDKPS